MPRKCIATQRSSIFSRFEWIFRWKNGNHLWLPGIYSVFFFWKTVPVSQTEFGQLANLNHWTKSLAQSDQRSKYSNTPRGCQIISIIFVEIDYLWIFDCWVFSFLSNPCPWVNIFVLWLGEFRHYKNKTFFRVAWHFWTNIFIVDYKRAFTRAS